MVQQSSPAKVCMEGIGAAQSHQHCPAVHGSGGGGGGPVVGWGPPGEDCKGADDKEFLLF